MILTITTDTNLRALSLKSDILQEVRDEKVKTWSIKEFTDSSDQKKKIGIYHDTEQTRDDNMNICFDVSNQGRNVIFTAYYPDGVELTRQEELFLLGRLSEMLIGSFSERFSTIQIAW